MRSCMFLILFMLAGCQGAPVIDRAQLDERYEQTALAEGVLSALPLRVDPADPPVVVNWWYAGSSDRWHLLVFRELTWDETGEPAGRELRYRVPRDELSVASVFASTRDAGRWVPLYEAVAGIAAPADTVTTFQRRGTVQPAHVAPEQVEPGDQRPVDLKDE